MSKEEIIEAVKAMTVVELSELVKAIEEEFGVSAVAAAAPAAASARSPHRSGGAAAVGAAIAHPSDRYRTSGSPPACDCGNVVSLFAPQRWKLQKVSAIMLAIHEMYQRSFAS